MEAMLNTETSRLVNVNVITDDFRCTPAFQSCCSPLHVIRNIVWTNICVVAKILFVEFLYLIMTMIEQKETPICLAIFESGDLMLPL